MYITEMNTKVVNLTQIIANKSVINIFWDNAIHWKLFYVPEDIDENWYTQKEIDIINKSSIDANNSSKIFNSVDSLLYDLNN